MKKVGTKNRHAQIPDGFEIVTSGLSQKGDRYIDVTNGDPFPCLDEDLGLPFDSFDCLIRHKPFPRWTLNTKSGILKAVSENIQFAPAYSGFAVMTLDEMRKYGEEHGGWIMQQDDGMSPPFVLYDYRSR